MTFFEGFESFVGVNFWTMIFAWCNLLILYVFLKKLLFKPVKKMIDDRQNEIDDMYACADKSKAEAEQLRSEYDKMLAEAHVEKENILKNAQRAALLREEEIIKEANEKAARVIERANEEVALEKKRAINEVKDEVSDLALNIAAAIIERDINEKEHASLIDDFISNMGEDDAE